MPICLYDEYVYILLSLYTHIYINKNFYSPNIAVREMTYNII